MVWSHDYRLPSYIMTQIKQCVLFKFDEFHKHINSIEYYIIYLRIE